MQPVKQPMGASPHALPPPPSAAFHPAGLRLHGRAVHQRHAVPAPSEEYLPLSLLRFLARALRRDQEGMLHHVRGGGSTVRL